MEQKTCFVVQGFGQKTDFTTGRKLNLDASYAVIKDAVEDAGLRCIRADEVVHSGSIDRPMYQWIMEADLVIADLSTYNVNAAYELGVRYGVAPKATITVAEDQFVNPFDVSHIIVHKYRHLGEDVGAAEARRFRRDLADVIRKVLAEQKDDSPIYEFFTMLPPRKADAPPAATRAVAPGPEAMPPEDASAKALLDRAKQAVAGGQWVVAETLLDEVHKIRPADEYVVQQLALAVYKSKFPSAVEALQRAKEILAAHLNPATTNNPETLGLWGAVHKRLWSETAEPQYLDAAIAAYERGYYLKQDYYNGINLAYLLDLRATRYAPAEIAEGIADAVAARRLRREVIQLCEPALTRAAAPEDGYWIAATLWEAAVGLGDAAAIARWRDEATKRSAAAWMLESTTAQLNSLTALLDASPLKLLPASR
jgi:hypothetical protein